MTHPVTRLARIELTVTDFARAARFYVAALGFTAGPARALDPAMAHLLAATSGEEVLLQLGGQVVALQRFDPPGDPYPPDATAADLIFQHFAVVTRDIAAAYQRLHPFAATPISRGGPQRLPAASGGATAYKFRDPDGHPLELIEFADRHAGGIDHTAIAVADPDRSIAFYRDQFGLTLQARQMNTGAEQDRLDGLDGVTVAVVALAPQPATPHVELLGYRAPQGRASGLTRPTDVAATRTVLERAGAAAVLMQDPDGHWVRVQAMDGAPQV